MVVGCDERLISLGIGKISKLKWGGRGVLVSVRSVGVAKRVCLCFLLSSFFPCVSMNTGTKGSPRMNYSRCRMSQNN